MPGGLTELMPRLRGPQRTFDPAIDPEPSSADSDWVPESSHWPIDFNFIPPTADHWNEERSDVPSLAQVFAGVAAARQAGS